jgi:hypothetical protein
MSALQGTEGLSLRIAQLQQDVAELRELVADLYRSNAHRDRALLQLDTDVNRVLALGGEPK